MITYSGPLSANTVSPSTPGPSLNPLNGCTTTKYDRKNSPNSVCKVSRVWEENTVPVALRASSLVRYVPSSCPGEDGVESEEEEEEEKEEEEEEEEEGGSGAIVGIPGMKERGGSVDDRNTKSSVRTKFTIDLNRLSGPLPVTSSEGSSHPKTLICEVTAVLLPSLAATLAPNQFPGLNSLGISLESGVFTQDLACTTVHMELDSTLRASQCPSPSKEVQSLIGQ